MNHSQSDHRTSLGSLKKSTRCIYMVKKERCKKWFEFKMWHEGIDRTHCPPHRVLIREQEAEQIILDRRIEQALKEPEYGY